jgi:hypothetical protein
MNQERKNEKTKGICPIQGFDPTDHRTGFHPAFSGINPTKVIGKMQGG